MDSEKQRGLWFLERILTDTSLKLGDLIPLSGRTSDILQLLNDKGAILSQIQITDQYLSDLPATRAYQDSSREHLEALEARTKNHSPDLYYCKTGVPLKIRIEWPIESMPQRDMTYVHVVVKNLAHSKALAGLSMMINQYDLRVALNRDFFLLEASVLSQ